jgi:hypothetical protein
VESYTTEGVNFMMELNEYMKQRAAIELQYATSIQKLIKPYKDELSRRANDKKATQYMKAIGERFNPPSTFVEFY